MRGSKRATTAVLIAAVVASAGAGCGGTRGGATWNEESGDSMGTLVARVAGHPRNIRYFINGKHYDPDYEIEWWRDARIELELPAGTYDVEAEYLVRAFAGDGETYRITTSEPVRVSPGRVTMLYARIDKDYRGVPKRQTEVFSVIHPTRSTGEPPQEGEPPAPLPEPHGALRASSPRESAATDVIRIRDENVQFADAGGWTPAPIASQDVRVRGTRVSFDALDPPRVQPDASTRITIRDMRVTQGPSSGARAVIDASSVESIRIRRNSVERGATWEAPRVDAQGGNTLRIRGGRVEQSSTAPRSAVPPDAPAELLRIRGTQVRRDAAPAAPAPGADAPLETLRIQGTRVTRE